MNLFDFSRAIVFDAPYSHVLAESAVSTGAAEALLGWAETDAPWSLVHADFYDQFEVDLGGCPLPPLVAAFCAPATLLHLKGEIGARLGVGLAGPVEAVMHKLVPGQRIRVHADQMEGGPRARLLLQLNRGWSLDQGGALLLFDGVPPDDSEPDARVAPRIVAPLHGSVCGFAISDRSLHAVSLIHVGTRFTLVYSFHG